MSGSHVAVLLSAVLLGSGVSGCSSTRTTAQPNYPSEGREDYVVSAPENGRLDADQESARARKNPYFGVGKHPNYVPKELR